MDGFQGCASRFEVDIRSGVFTVNYFADRYFFLFVQSHVIIFGFN